MSKKISIIGSGFSALSASCYLAKAGHQVSIFEKNDTVGGRARQLIKEATEKILSEFDFIVIPTTPTTAFKLGQHQDSPLEMYMADLFTVQASVTGIPAISIPMGNDSNNLPIGIQIMSRAFDENKLFAISKSLLKEETPF